MLGAGGLPKEFTTRWLLDDKQFKAEMRDLAKEAKGVRSEFSEINAAVKKISRQHVTDLRHAWDLVKGAIQQVYQWTDRLLRNTSEWKQFKQELSGIVDKTGDAVVKTAWFKVKMDEATEGVRLASTWLRLMAGGMDMLQDSSRGATIALARFFSVLPGGIGAVGKQMREVISGMEEARDLAPHLFRGELHRERPKAKAKTKKSGRGKAESEVGPYGLGGWRSPSGFGQLEAMEGAIAEEEGRAEALESMRAERREVEDLVAKYHKLTATKSDVQDADIAFVEAQEKKLAKLRELNGALKEIAFGGLADFAGGIWEAADAAIMGADSFGMAIAKMLKKTLLGIATESTVRAVFETAQGFASMAVYDYKAATEHFTSAGIFAAVAATAGAAGLAASAGISAGGGYGSDAGERRRERESNQYRPSYGQRQEVKQPDIYVNVYLNGSEVDPGAVLIANQKIQTAIAKAA